MPSTDQAIKNKNATKACLSSNTMQKKHKITRKTINMTVSSSDEGPHANDLFSRTNAMKRLKD